MNSSGTTNDNKDSNKAHCNTTKNDIYFGVPRDYLQKYFSQQSPIECKIASKV